MSAQPQVIRPPSPGELINQLDAIRKERAELSKRDKELKDLWRELEWQLINLCDEMQMKRMSTGSLTATVTEETLPQLDDFDELWGYIKATDSPHLLYRRVASGAYRELQDAGIDVPGVTPYTQRKISLRTV